MCSSDLAHLCGLLAGEIGVDVKVAKRAGLLHDIGKSIDHEIEGSHVQIGADLCRKYKESAIVVNAVEAHHGDVEPESLIACLVQAADTISAARPGARRETLETYTTRLIEPDVGIRGIGSAIIHFFECEAKSQGVDRVSLTTDLYENKNVLAFYKKNGYEVYYEFMAYPNRKMVRLIKKI